MGQDPENRVEGRRRRRHRHRRPSLTRSSKSPNQETVSETEAHFHAKSSAIELPGIAQMKQAGLLTSSFDPSRPRQLLPSILSKSLPGGARSSTLPPIQRREKVGRPRKSSIAQHARRPQHEKKRSRGEHLRRMSYDGRKAFSAEPSGPPPTMGKRWEDLIDAATSATEDVDGDRTPVSAQTTLSPFFFFFFFFPPPSPIQILKRKKKKKKSDAERERERERERRGLP